MWLCGNVIALLLNFQNVDKLLAHMQRALTDFVRCRVVCHLVFCQETVDSTEQNKSLSSLGGHSVVCLLRPTEDSVALIRIYEEWVFLFCPRS